MLQKADNAGKAFTDPVSELSRRICRHVRYITGGTGDEKKGT